MATEGLVMPVAAPPFNAEGETAITRPALASGSCGAGSIERIYITDRLHGEGPLAQRTFDVHSSSTDDGLLLRFAQEYPHDLASGGPVYAAARRLALVLIPGGKSALIHTLFLPTGQSEHANGLLSEVLIHPALRARQALATWDSPGWSATIPTDTGARLRPLVELPMPGPIDDQAVTRFLHDERLEPPGESSLYRYPERLQAAPGQRRNLLRQILRGCQLALQANGTTRARFYLLAEPELAALLLYAAARLLPETLASKFSFSTWEPPQNLRNYKHARIIGTFPGAAGDELDEYCFTTGGYAVDTFRFKCSPELEGGDQSEIEDWLELAAGGQWQEVERIYQVLGRDSATISFHDARQAHRLDTLLASGSAQIEDLLAAKNSSWGPAILDKHRLKLWPVVRDASLQDVVVRATFADWLVAQLPELERDAAAALRRGTASGWRPYWQLLRAALREDVESLRQTLLRILPDDPYPPDLRLGLLEELSRLQLHRADAPARFQALLMHCTAEDLELLAHADLDREWYVWALLHALVSRGTASVAITHVHGADDELLRVFWGQFRLLKKEEQRRAILAPLFLSEASEGAAVDGPGARFLGRVLKQRWPIPVATLAWLLDSLGAWQEEWQPFWTTEKHLGFLTEAIAARGPGAEAIWERLCGQINGALLLAGNAYQQALLLELGAARSRGFLPEASAAALADWILLRQHFEKASTVPDGARQGLLQACERRQVDAIKLLAGYFEKFVLLQALDKEVLDDFTGFFHSFLAEGREYDDHSRRLVCWLQVVDSCPDEEQKALYQRYYLEHHVPEDFRWRLAQETHELGKLLPTAYESVVKPTAKAELFGERGLGSADLFTLAGVRPSDEGMMGPGLVSRSTALLPAVVAGIGAVLLCSWYKDFLRNDIFLTLFLPPLLALTDAVALQSAALSLGSTGGQGPKWKRIFDELRPGLVLGTVSALIVGGLATLRGARFEFTLALGAALLASLTCAALLGMAVPLAFRRWRLDARLSSGTAARALADLAAVLIYLVTTCRLLS